MTGLEISRLFYAEYALPMLKRDFPDELCLIAAGLAGQGSECLGFDDELSRDHDFGPGVCLWIPRRESARIGAALSAAYARLPSSIPECAAAPVNPERAARVGVHTVEGFYEELIGRADAPETAMDWLRIPERFLSQACSGEVFADPLGEFSAVRRALLGFYPEDALKKKLAANLAAMAQAGQYNYPRCIKRGDYGAAYLACGEFIRHALAALYLLNAGYMPFYKWAFRGTAGFTALPDCAGKLRALASMPDLTLHRQKLELTEEICGMFVFELCRRGMTDGADGFLQYHAERLTESISDARLRALPIMYGGA